MDEKAKPGALRFLAFWIVAISGSWLAVLGWVSLIRACFLDAP